MSNETKTAVDWLEKNMWEHIEYKPTLEIQRIRKKIQQAKEMEKEQIIKACDAGFDTANLFIEDMKYQSAEDYYEQTYGGNK